MTRSTFLSFTTVKSMAKVVRVPLSINEHIQHVKLRNPNPGYICLTDEIDEESAIQFERHFRVLEHSPCEFIMIYIHSDGGCVYSALRIVDIMKSSEKRCVTVCSGCAMSAAALIFSQGELRFMSEIGTIMVHDASMGMSEGRLNDVEVEATELRRLTEQGYEMMSLNIGKKKNFFEKRMGKANVDAYISCAEAHKINLCTHIGIPQMKTRVDVSIELSCNGIPLSELKGTRKSKKRKKSI